MIKELLEKKLKKETVEKVEKYTLIECKVGNLYFYVNLEDIHTILDLKPIVDIPGTPAHILGVIYYQGEVIPVIDLKQYFNQTTMTATKKEEARIVIFKIDDEQVGIFVDEASKMYSVPKEIFEKIDEDLFKLKGIYDDREFKVFDSIKCYNQFKID